MSTAHAENQPPVIECVTLFCLGPNEEGHYVPIAQIAAHQKRCAHHYRLQLVLAGKTEDEIALALLEKRDLENRKAFGEDIFPGWLILRYLLEQISEEHRLLFEQRLRREEWNRKRFKEWERSPCW